MKFEKKSETKNFVFVKKNFRNQKIRKFKTLKSQKLKIARLAQFNLVLSCFDTRFNFYQNREVAEACFKFAQSQSEGKSVRGNL